MNCGKSTNLLQIAHNYEEQGMTVLIGKPSVDTKGEQSISSRLGVTRKVDFLINKDFTGDNLKADCLLIDEVQFLEPQQIDTLYRIAVEKDIPVICFGLRTDFLNRGFPGSSRLLELAHSIKETKNVCSCGRKATCNIRLVDSMPTFIGEQVSIDGSKETLEYRAVCSNCFLRMEKEYNGTK